MNSKIEVTGYTQAAQYLQTGEKAYYTCAVHLDSYLNTDRRYTKKGKK